MATASAQPTDYECPICHEHFSTPKILPCAHLLCRQCVVTWLKSDGTAMCPICRDVIVDATSRAGKSLDDIADALPTDLAMEARVECAAILSKPHKCGCCKNTAGTAICLDCGDTLCCTCTAFHGNMLATRDHKVEDLSSMTAELLASARRVPCLVHANKTSELFCPVHGATICHLCDMSTHRACTEVRDLEKKMEEARGELAELAATLKAGEIKLERAIGQLDAYLWVMEKATQATLADIDLKFDQLSKCMDACRRRFREHATQPLSEFKERVDEEKAALLKRRGKAMSHWRLVDRVGDRMPRVCGVSDLPTRLKTAVHNIGLDCTLPADFKAATMATIMLDKKGLEGVERAFSELCLLTDWRFHTNHGVNIVLSENQQTAERVKGETDALTISSHAITSDTLCEVRLDVTDGDTSAWYLLCGVTDGDPASVTLPKGAAEWPSAVVIGYTGAWMYGPKKTVSDVGKPLSGLRAGSRVGVMVDAGNQLHLYVDGQDRGVAASNIRRPCHAFFSVSGAYKQISTVPLRNVLSLSPKATSS